MTPRYGSSRRVFLARIGVPGAAVSPKALLLVPASARYFGGEPWVGVDNPVVSTDQRISVRLSERGL